MDDEPWTCPHERVNAAGVCVGCGEELDDSVFGGADTLKEARGEA
jgi:hypothetical protein